uniref:NB-ARC domain-containing protein n=1 Tax=Oryza brachyantha TaxID=4533 RepID=J3N7B5_ORYBR
MELDVICRFGQILPVYHPLPGVVSLVLEKISTLIEKEYSKLKGVRDEILSLKDELSSMNALLLKLSDIEDLDVQVKEWRNQIRELSYDIEDCIDNFMHQVGSSSNNSDMKCFCRKIIHQVRALGACHAIANNILKLKARVDSASERRMRYNFDGVISSSSAAAPADPRLPALYAEVESLVGIDEPTNDMIKWLTEGGDSVQKLKVVSIWGPGGLGKTTLARQVYDKIARQFDYRAFVSVSQKPDMRKIFRNILTSLTGVEHVGIEAWDEELLINKLRDFIDGKSFTNICFHGKMHNRYFIVIDDIWSTTDWQTIRCVLLDSNIGSRVLTTTQISYVAESCCLSDQDKVFEMKHLSAIHAEKLFLKRIFGSGDNCPPHLKEVSDDILRRCGGLPLAIITMASLLVNKPQTEEQWEKYRDSIVENDPIVKKMQEILSLSYTDLPHHLKTCLLYLSTFPEDFIIERDRLIRRWIAEGFIATEGGRSLEDVGEHYFNELISRSLIQVVGIKYDDRSNTCRVHDMVLDLIVSKSIEENFITFIGYQNRVCGLQDKVRRLSLKCHHRDGHARPSTRDVSCARSFTVYGSTNHMPPISEFQSLRVINIENNDTLDNHYLNGIGRLFQLKYLRLIEVSISKLPEEIGELQQLVTLELEHTKIKELPKGITRLKNLVFLRADYKSLPKGIGNMKALQKLSWVKVNSTAPSVTLQEMGDLTELRYLDLSWCIDDMYSGMKSYTESFVSSIIRLCQHKLQYLRIRSDVSKGCSLKFMLDSWSSPPHLLQKFDMFTDYYFPRIPEWMASLSKITFLDISVNPVGKDTLRILGNFRSLNALRLWTKTVASKGEFIVRNIGFPCLEEFYFGFWRVQMGPITFEVGAMPKLKKFLFDIKAQGAGPPSGDFDISIHHISSLKYLRVGIDCREARACEVEVTEAAVRNATSVLHNNLHIEIERHWPGQMVKDETGSTDDHEQDRS